MTASQAFSQKLYEAAARDAERAGTSAVGQAGGAGGADDDEIVDAEIVDEDEVSDVRPTDPDGGDRRRAGVRVDADRRASTTPTPTTSRRRVDAEADRRGVDGRPTPCAVERDQFKDIALAAAGRLRELPQARRQRSAATRSTGPPAGSSRRCCRCSTPARRPSRTAPTSVEPIWSTCCSASCSKQGLEALDLHGQAVRPRASPKRSLHEAGDGGERRSSPRCCAPATAGRARSCARPWSRSTSG